MGEDLDLYKPTDIELKKNMRYLRSIGLPHIGVSIRGDVYNQDTDNYLGNRENYVFNIDGKPHGFTKIALLKQAFKFDENDPSKILDLQNKDDITEISLSWDFYHNQKSYLLTDFKSATNFLNRVTKTVSMNLRYNSLGLYNIKTDRYYTISKNGTYNVGFTHNHKKVKVSIPSTPLLNELKQIEESNTPVAPISPLSLNETTELKHVIEIEGQEKIEHKKVERVKMEKVEKIQENTETRINKMAVLEFINDVLTMDLDLVAEKYKVSKEILKVLKK